MFVQSSELKVESSASKVPVPVPVPVPVAVQSCRIPVIRVGLLGLGHVGQAVVRLADDGAEAERLGTRFTVERALVRDVSRARRCQWQGRVTDSQAVFLDGDYDVVIEALGAIEPARSLVAQLLWRGTAVVTANKALVAAHGAELDALASEAGTSFRYEACALSAIPFIGTLARRPLVASIDRLTAIVNGTSNFVITQLDSGASFADALRAAQDAGFAEPDAARDIDGLDAADKLTLLAALFGWGDLSAPDLEVTGVSSVTTDDLRAAREIGGVIKPIVRAVRGANGVDAFVGPALLSSAEPLAALGGALNGIRLDGRHVSDLFFSGPGAGPDVTAATLLDDAIEAREGEGGKGARGARGGRGAKDATGAVRVDAPVTPWFLRFTFPGVVPSNSALEQLLLTAGLELDQIVERTVANSRWLTIRDHSRIQVEAASTYLRATHRIEIAFIRRLS